MASDDELARRLREVLRTSDLSTTSTSTVRRQLEAEFGIDLSGRKSFIREQVELFLQSMQEDEVKEEDEEEEVDGKEEEDEEGEEEEEEDEEGSSSNKRKSTCKESKRRGGFTKVCSLSEELQKFVGEPELARTEVVKKLWEYIRANSLQDPNNKRKIRCDEKFKRLFNVDTIDMFQMNKALTKHIWPKEDGLASADKLREVKPKDKQQSKPRNEGKKQKTGSGGGGGFCAPIQLSNELVEFIGTGETKLPRSDVVKRMWNYIKEKNLQDPADKRNIICDEKLKELLKVDSFNGFTVSKLLNTHFIKTSE